MTYRVNQMSKTRPYVKYDAEDTSGDGNCAFNAFILGFWTEANIKQVEANLAKNKLTADDKFEKFIKLAAPKLGVAATWNAVKQKALELRCTRAGSVQLQKALAEPMRDLAIELLAIETKEDYEKSALYRKNAAYKKYKEDKKKTPSLGLADKENPFTPYLQRHLVGAFEYTDSFDDVFKRHSFITDKFKELRNDVKTNAKEKKQGLKKWWKEKNGGFNQFLDKMKESGNFAGDLELKQITKYFGANLDIFGPRHVSRLPYRAYETHQDAPTITLTNPSSVHWSNVIVTAYASEDEFKAKQKEEQAAIEQAKAEAKKAAAEKAAAEKAERKIAAEKAAAEKEAKKAAEKVIALAKKESEVAAKDFITSTLKYLKTNAAKPEESKWKEWQAIVDKATAEAGDASILNKDVSYALANAVKLIKPTTSTESVIDAIAVTKETQVALDAELAKALQQQPEYAGFGKRK